MRRELVGLLAVLGFASAAPAHDYWLEPETFFPKVNAPVAVRLLVGDDLLIELERPFQKKPTLRFDLVNKDKTIDLAAMAQEGEKPVARVTIAQAGSHWLVMDRDLAYLTLEAKKFNAYLEEEGLTDILAERKKKGESDTPGHERYRRFLKCLLQVGDATDDAWKKIFSQKLEVLPLVNPATRKPGDVLPIKVLFDGKPLAAAPIFAYHGSEDKVTKQQLHTDKDGTAAVRLDTAGIYLVRLVHMRRVDGDPKADWESFWTSFSFGVR